MKVNKSRRELQLAKGWTKELKI